MDPMAKPAQGGAKPFKEQNIQTYIQNIPAKSLARMLQAEGEGKEAELEKGVSMFKKTT